MESEKGELGGDPKFFLGKEWIPPCCQTKGTDAKMVGREGLGLGLGFGVRGLGFLD